MNNQPSRFRKIKGQVSVLFVLSLTVLLAFLAIGVDVGYIIFVRNQLQNAADAAALTGAAFLFPTTPSGSPNWTLAQSKAQTAITINKVDGVMLQTGVVTAGYYDISGAGGLKSTSITPGSNDIAAVQVSITKSGVNNGGPINLFLGPFVGKSTVDLTVKAVAGSGSPSGVKAGDLFPLAMAASLYSTYWDSATNSPKIDPSTGQPYIFHIASGPGGEWTTFNSSANDVTTVQNLMTTGNPVSYSIGDSIWIAPGVKTALYGSVPTNKNVAVAIVGSISSHSLQPIIAFSGIHIINAVGGSSKYVAVQFLQNYKIENVPVGGPNYGVHTPPKLLN